MTVIQQRAPYAPGQLKAFAQNLSEWIKATGFKDVIVLSGLDAGKQLGAHSLPQQRVRFIAMSSSGSQQEAASSAGTSDLDAYEQRCRELSWPVLEDFTPTERETSANGGHHARPFPEAPSGESISYGSMFGIDNGLERGQWWGPGKAYRKTAFWKMAEALKDQGVSVFSLLLLCSEGDNVPDGLALATTLDSLLRLRDESKQGTGPGGWEFPLSWASIYGPPPDTSLFG